MKRVQLGMLVVVAIAAACGDPETTDDRGYTKAPLENPGWIVDGENASRMSELGEPNRIPEMGEVQDEVGEAAPAPAENGEATEGAAAQDSAAANAAAAADTGAAAD